MRIAQKRIILDALESLEQAHEKIKSALNQKNLSLGQNMQNILLMLSECQEFAVSIGESIEKLEGEGHVTIASLESYCETLYKIYTELNNTGGNDAYKNKVYKMLKKQLIKIENSVKNDIAVRKEIVFLPYKAAMWDSMESVYLAAKEDETCDVYVIPIPYFEKNPDQSFGKMYCETEEYPDYVPVTGWRAYKIEERRPDIIYIQNPYDDWNYVTCVHPRYFSKELKKYTDMLVYLPYFVGVGNHVEGHLCTVPGVKNADRVIVQSENVKNDYIESIRKYEKENHCEGRFGDLDKKFVVAESPKLEHIRRVMENEEIEIPEEWKTKIYPSGGKRETIILYNTTIGAFLEYSGIYLDKLRSVLDLFRQEKGVVLLWRPHPLLESTIKSMRPDLYTEYTEIVRAYREENWGIYDETADIARAIVLSDAYFGDWSSVVEMYKVTGKPVMIQKCEMPSV